MAGPPILFLAPWLGIASLLTLALFSGCAGSFGRPEAAPALSAGPGGAPVEPERRLFRIGYQGPEGGGSLRLALFIVDAERFQARASDSFGRGLWSVELDGEESRWIDHRRRQSCVGRGAVRIPELTLGALPLDRLPRVLRGELPVDPPRAGAVDFRDADGNRWTRRTTAGELQAWTLWSAARPLLWWQRRDQGGILSHREGSQFRWRQSLTEPLDEPPAPLVAPAAYGRVDCAELIGEADGAPARG